MADLSYVRFRKLAETLAQRMHTSVEMVFEPIGLMVQPEGAHFDYFCTPVNSVTFATTGGDGVHFGLLVLEHRPTSPIVMTVPMSDAQNVVAAEDLLLEEPGLRSEFRLAQTLFQLHDLVGCTHVSPQLTVS